MRLILALFISIIFTLTAQAAQKAIVKVNRAVIYSDTTGKTPLGYIPRGKLIRVGSRLRGGGRFLPLVFKRKIVYIKVTDLWLAKEVDEAKAQREKYPQIVTRLESMAEDGFNLSVSESRRLISNSWAVNSSNSEGTNFASVSRVWLASRKKAVKEWGFGLTTLTSNVEGDKLLVAALQLEYARRFFALEKQQFFVTFGGSYAFSAKVEDSEGTRSESYYALYPGLSYRYRVFENWDLRLDGRFIIGDATLSLGGMEVGLGLTYFL